MRFHVFRRSQFGGRGLAGACAAWMFFAAADPVSQSRRGLPSAVLLILSMMIRLGMCLQIHADRLMRERGRIGLRIALGPGG